MKRLRRLSRLEELSEEIKYYRRRTEDGKLHFLAIYDKWDEMPQVMATSSVGYFMALREAYRTEDEDNIVIFDVRVETHEVRLFEITAETGFCGEDDSTYVIVHGEGCVETDFNNFEEVYSYAEEFCQSNSDTWADSNIHIDADDFDTEEEYEKAYCEEFEQIVSEGGYAIEEVCLSDIENYIDFIRISLNDYSELYHKKFYKE